MENSPLARLPGELRTQIYELVLALSHPIEITVHHESSTAQASGAPLALTSTCRTIREQTLKLFYSTNNFILRTKCLYLLHRGHDDYNNAWISPLFEWIHSIGSDKLEPMGDLTLDMDCTEILDLEGDSLGESFRECWSTATRAPHGLCSLQGPVLRYRQPCKIKLSVNWGLHDDPRPTVDAPVDEKDFKVEFMLGSTRATTETSLESTEDKILEQLRSERPAGDYSLAAEMLASMCVEACAMVREIVLDETPW